MLYFYTANFRLILHFQFKGHIFECELRIAVRRALVKQAFSLL